MYSVVSKVNNVALPTEKQAETAILLLGKNPLSDESSSVLAKYHEVARLERCSTEHESQERCLGTSRIYSTSMVDEFRTRALLQRYRTTERNDNQRTPAGKKAVIIFSNSLVGDELIACGKLIRSDDRRDHLALHRKRVCTASH